MFVSFNNQSLLLSENKSLLSKPFDYLKKKTLRKDKSNKTGKINKKYYDREWKGFKKYIFNKKQERVKNKKGGRKQEHVRETVDM